MVVTINRTKYKDCKYPEHEIFVTKYKEKNSNVYQFNAEDFRSGVLLGRLHCSTCEFMDGKLEPVAHDCGIGDVLTRLCLIDRDVNGSNAKIQLPLNNECQAVKILENYPEKLRWTKSHTDGLLMAGRSGGLMDSVFITLGALLLLLLAAGYHTVIFIGAAITSLNRPSLDTELGIIFSVVLKMIIILFFKRYQKVYQEKRKRKKKRKKKKRMNLTPDVLFPERPLQVGMKEDGKSISMKQ